MSDTFFLTTSESTFVRHAYKIIHTLFVSVPKYKIMDLTTDHFLSPNQRWGAKCWFGLNKVWIDCVEVGDSWFPSNLHHKNIARKPWTRDTMDCVTHPFYASFYASIRAYTGSESQLKNRDEPITLTTTTTAQLLQLFLFLTLNCSEVSLPRRKC